MPQREEAEAAAERIASRLRNYNQQTPQDRISLFRLLLEILAEELRIHRLHLEKRVRQPMDGTTNASRTSRGDNYISRGTRSGSYIPRGTRGDDSVSHGTRGGHYNSRGTRSDSHASRCTRGNSYLSRGSRESPQRMTGATSRSPTQSPSNQPSSPPRDHRRRRRRHRHPSPLGDPPRYRPRVGLTMGLIPYVQACVEWETRRLAREAYRTERRARRLARREGRGVMTEEEPRSLRNIPGDSSHDAPGNTSRRTPGNSSHHTLRNTSRHIPRHTSLRELGFSDSESSVHSHFSSEGEGEDMLPAIGSPMTARSSQRERGEASEREQVGSSAPASLFR